MKGSLYSVYRIKTTTKELTIFSPFSWSKLEIRVLILRDMPTKPFAENNCLAGSLLKPRGFSFGQPCFQLICKYCHWAQTWSPSWGYFAPRLTSKTSSSSCAFNLELAWKVAVFPLYGKAKKSFNRRLPTWAPFNTNITASHTMEINADSWKSYPSNCNM